MSHATVLVVGPDYDAALAPFDENGPHPEQGKWDWYTLGGRFEARRSLIDTTGAEVLQCLRRDLNLEALHARTYPRPWACFAIVTADGEWIENGAWLDPGYDDAAEAAWARRFNELVLAQPADVLLSLVDFHS